MGLIISRSYFESKDKPNEAFKALYNREHILFTRSAKYIWHLFANQMYFVLPFLCQVPLNILSIILYGSVIL